MAGSENIIGKKFWKYSKKIAFPTNDDFDEDDYTAAELEDAEEKAFAQIYEKARYAETSCTKEEMEQMLRVR